MKNISDNKCIRCIIFGRVQGVFFRYSTQRQAQRLGVVGYAKNLPDGSVEVVACGSAIKVDELKKWLHKGPEGARVTSIECASVNNEDFVDFQTF